MKNKEDQNKLEEKKENIFPEPNNNVQKNKLDLHTIKLLIVVFLAITATFFVIIYTFFHLQSVKQAQRNAEYQKQLSDLQLKQQQSQTLPMPSNINRPVPAPASVKPAEIETGMIELDKIDVKWKKESAECDENYKKGDICFLVGNIRSKGTIYDGLPFYLEGFSVMSGYSFRHFTILNGKMLYAEPENPGEKSATVFGIDDISEKISFPGSNYKLLKNGYVSDLFSEIETKEKIFTDNDLGDFYLTAGGCLMTELPDHTAISYNFEIPFLNEEKSEINFKFNDGKKNKETYSFIQHSCGSSCTRLSIVEKSEINPDERFEIVGKTSNGEDIYGIKNPTDQYLIDLYNDKNTMAYIETDSGSGYASQEKSKYSYEEFINSQPYLYWKDPLGRWVESLNRKYESAAEMCKPVIYLYPQSQLSLNIKVNPNGGFTHTEPVYDNGWNIEVAPDGKIKNLRDGSFYDYLLWEGLGIDYPDNNKGWVVEKDELDSFFNEKLHQLGLNNKEIFDFKGYWLGRMNEKPYYKIYFLSKSEFGLLAPIEFAPVAPDTFIRVMMTAKGLNNFESIPEQKLPKIIPERKGFSAVEWGGTLIK